MTETTGETGACSDRSAAVSSQGGTTPGSTRPRGLGIGVITFNRRATLAACVAAIEKFTRTPYYLIIADDGSTDGTAAWAAGKGIPVVSGRNQGPARNKNRALSLLMDETDCDPILLIEDDTHPVIPGWEEPWVEAAMRYPQINFTSQQVRAENSLRRGTGTVDDPYWGRVQSAQVTGTRRAIIEQFGYLDSRFVRFGEEHVEWSDRIFGKRGWQDDLYWCGLDSGVVTSFDNTFASPWSWFESIALVSLMREDRPYRPAYCNGPERYWIHQAEHEHEMQRARWSQKPHVGEPGLVSLIVPTACRRRALRLHDRLGDGPNHEFIWVWNGVGPLDLPGTIVRYNPPDRGWPQSVNHGAMHASGDVLWILDDSHPASSGNGSRELIDPLRESFARDDRLGLVYGSPGRPGDPSHPLGSAGSWAIRRFAFEKIGGLDETVVGRSASLLVVWGRLALMGYAREGMSALARPDNDYLAPEDSDIDSASLTDAGIALGATLPRKPSWSDYDEWLQR